MKKVVISAEEKALFRDEIEKMAVKKLSERSGVSNKTVNKNVPKISGVSHKNTNKNAVKKDTNFNIKIIDIPLSDNYTNVLSQEESVSYFSEGFGLEPSVLKQIKSGEYPVDQKMDLHGDTIESSRKKLIHYFQKAETTQARFLLLVHGKGHQAKLKNHVIHWLKQIPLVLFFCSAQPKDGGTGALYVFLKKRKVQTDNLISTRSSTQDSELNKRDLKAIRNQIDKIDKNITELLSQRFACAKQAFALKKIKEKDSKREEEILNAVGQQAESAGYSKKYVQKIFMEILEQMRKYQKNK